MRKLLMLSACTLCLVGCSVPSDYADRMNEMLNQTRPLTHKVDAMIEKGDTTGFAAAVRDLSDAKSLFETVGNFRDDNMVIVPIVSWLDYYTNEVPNSVVQNCMDIATRTDKSQEEVIALEEMVNQHRKSSYELESNVVGAYMEFCKKYELIYDGVKFE